jgi:cytochrome P450
MTTSDPPGGGAGDETGGLDPLDDDLDTFERSALMAGLGVAESPYPEYPAQRAEHVVAQDLSGLTADGSRLVVYTAASYDAVFEVLRDGRRFSSAGYAEVMEPVLGRTILQMDEPEHGAYRSLLAQAFRPKAIERWEADVVAPLVDGAIDGFAGDGRAELVRQLTFPFPIGVVAALLDLPRDRLDEFHRLAIELIGVEVDLERAGRAGVRVGELVQPLVDARRDAPGADLVSLLAQAEHGGQRLSDEEILAFCRLLLPAGAETTYRSLGNLLVGLLTHPDQLAAVRDDRTLIPQAIDEGLRWETPVLTIFRTATEDTEVCGVPIPAGAGIAVNMGSANHDEWRWHDPERFDVFRPALPGVSFAPGPHSCLGMHLARTETRVALGRLLDRLPNLRLDPAHPPPVIVGRTFRSPAEICVVFD